MLRMKPAEKWELKIKVDCPQVEPGSYITGRLTNIDRETREKLTIPHLKRIGELKRQQDSGELPIEDVFSEIAKCEAEVLRVNYVGFDGTPDDDPWWFVLKGPLSQWLVAAASGAIMDSIERSRRGNSNASHGR